MIGDRISKLVPSGKVACRGCNEGERDQDAASVRIERGSHKE